MAKVSGPSANPNVMSGLASGINTDQVINGLMAAEGRRAEPIVNRKEQIKVRLDSFTKVKGTLETLKGSAEVLADSGLWEGKLVTSSNEGVVTASATRGAKPGKHTLVVDKLALNHQITSQGYPQPTSSVGTGTIKLGIGDGAMTTVAVDASNNTLEGVKNAINNSSADVTAAIIKTGHPEQPYQLVLTSKKTGEQGRIKLEIKLTGGEALNYENGYELPSDWKGAMPKPKAGGAAPAAGGVSNSVIRVVGEYNNEEDHTFTFTAVQSGKVGGETALQLRWEDETGRNGVIDLDSFHYAPGEPVAFADGLSLVLSEGDVSVGDAFNVRGRSARSENYWWLKGKEKLSAVSQPSRWDKQKTEGAPEIKGTFTGEEEKEFTLTIAGSGQVGVADNLDLLWKTSTGESGKLRLGKGYQPGTALALANGLTVSVKGGVLSEGDTTSFTAEPKQMSTMWWKDNATREIPAKVAQPGNWFNAKEAEEESKDISDIEQGEGPQLPMPEPEAERKSTTKAEVRGKFTGDTAKVYTFTALKDGSIGVSKDLKIKWEDDKGHSGEFPVGEGYMKGFPLPMDEGLSMAFGTGRVYEGDTFTLRTRTSSIMPPQDALVRLGATEFGGGIPITSSVNELDDVIEGVKLNLVSISDKPVTISISGDTEKAVGAVKKMVDDYNAYAGLVNDLSKFDKDTNTASPLLGDRDMTNIKMATDRGILDPVAGLPKSTNMLMSVGIKMDDKGLLKLDENKLREKVKEDFGQVAALFRDKGESTHAGISVVGMTDDTPVNTVGMDVDITQVATQGYYLSPVLFDPVVVDNTNNKVLLTVDGRKSESITLESGKFTVGEYAKMLQNKISNDKSIGGLKVAVSVQENRIRVMSNRYGAVSAIAFAPGEGVKQAGVGLTAGESHPGKDVQGTVDGLPAEGTGQVLKVDESKSKGLRLFVNLIDSQLVKEQPEAKITVTRGVGSRLNKYLKGVLADGKGGDMKRITEGLKTNVKDYDKQLEDINERMVRKRTMLKEKFARMETQMQKLKSQQSYVGGQLANMPSASSALPGL
ncbi:MAG: flagellar filament capping protein FliD [Deltaproteobacteria bacterium]|nr:flagellar filament capping protein FliD [Deltaproteobacteria bacterium]